MIITVDLYPFAPPPLLALGEQAMLDQVIALVADGARAEWIRLAQEKLTGSQLDYVNGIQPVEYETGFAIVTLLGELPNQIEHGMPARDMREFLLGAKVPVVARGSGQKGKYKSKDGHFYRYIPFRHRVGKGGAGFGAPFAKAGMALEDAAKLGKDIYKQARALEASRTTPGKVGTQWGGKTGNVGPKLKAHHKSPLFAQMYRMEKTYEKATQNQYVTFRTISTRVTDGWMQSAQPGVHLVEGVQAYVQQIAPMAFDEYAKAALGENQ